MRPSALALVFAFALGAGCVAQSASNAITPASHLGPDGDCLRFVAGVDLQLATIEDMQAALAGGQVTSVQLVQAYVARIDAFDNGGPRVNSVQVVGDGVLDEAAALDAERAAGHVRGPLHGIPILLKDNIGTNDMPTTAGSIALALNVPPEDATLTARLREAGAIIVGKTQLSEFANWMSLSMPNGFSSLGGQVRSAYTGGDPSGSSSGSGVAGSMAMAAATIGTETSGSILSPSNVNSLVGVKPTVGLVSRAGVIPLAGSFDTPGPMTRNVFVERAGLLEIALIPNEFKAQLNHYLATEAGPETVVDSLTEIILYNQAHASQIPYGQNLLIASEATPGVMQTTGPLALPVIAANRVIVDQRFARDDLDAIVGPGTAYVSTGAAAGYPTVIVPAGYNGRAPTGVSFFGPAWSEAELLSYAYAYEQVSKRRETPAAINPAVLTGVCGAGGAPFVHEALAAPGRDVI